MHTGAGVVDHLIADLDRRAFWLRQKAAEIKARLSAEQLATLQNAAGIAVKAAEQAGLSKQLASGSEKREYAIKVAQDYLNTVDVRVDVKAITSLIESEVLKQFNGPTPIVDSPEARAALLQKAVESGVLAAEQSGLKAAAMNVGVSLAQQKKQYAVNLAGKYFRATRHPHGPADRGRVDRSADHALQDASGGGDSEIATAACARMRKKTSKVLETFEVLLYRN